MLGLLHTTYLVFSMYLGCRYLVFSYKNQGFHHTYAYVRSHSALIDLNYAQLTSFGLNWFKDPIDLVED